MSASPDLISAEVEACLTRFRRSSNKHLTSRTGFITFRQPERSAG